MNQSLGKQRSTSQDVLLILGIVFVGFNLRPALTSVGPVISDIQRDMSISHGVAGFLTTLPLLAFAVLSLLAPKISHNLGNERTIMIGLAVLLVGIIIRSSGWMSGLFAGTVFIGAGIAACNVLLPSVVKSKFPKRVGLMTSVYTTCMGLCATIASGVSVPLAHGLGMGWQWALACWGILAIVGMIAWISQLGKEPSGVQQAQASITKIWRSPLAWKLAFFMGLQSFLFYSIIAWLPEIVHSQGLSSSMAGFMLAFVQLAGLPGTFIAPVLADRYADQRMIIVGIGVLYFVGIAGLLFGGNLPLIMFWCLLIGLAQGATISLSLALIGLRSANSTQTATLSGMAQSFGYLLAAFGPIIVGFLFDSTGLWVYPIIIMLLATVLMILAGLGAGRNQTVEA